MRVRRDSFTTRAIVIASLLLLAANFLLGGLLMSLSRGILVQQIQARMMDTARTAASLLDGDELELLEAEDVGTEPYERAMETLAIFHSNTEIRYIYGIRDEGDGTFTFTVDPTVDDPAQFGEQVAYTDALYAASQGTPSVDDEPYEDRWGRFYSAYCPVYDSRGEIAGIVGVDFAAEWIDEQTARIVRTIVASSIVSLLVGALVVYLATSQVRKRLRTLREDVSSLAQDLDALVTDTGVESPHSPPDGTLGAQDAYDLSGAIRLTRDELRGYIDYVRKRAYTDGLTGVGNQAAYQSCVDALEPAIREGTAAFSMAIFDINGLKRVNDTMGHEWGDKVIEDAAQVISGVYGRERTFRIGGDEFVVVLDGAGWQEAVALFDEMDKALAAFNAGKRGYEDELSISRGRATFVPGVDEGYMEVFRRADVEMYRNKAAWYQSSGVRRRGIDEWSSERRRENREDTE